MLTLLSFILLTTHSLITLQKTNNEIFNLPHPKLCNNKTNKEKNNCSSECYENNEYFAHFGNYCEIFVQYNHGCIKSNLNKITNIGINTIEDCAQFLQKNSHEYKLAEFRNNSKAKKCVLCNKNEKKENTLEFFLEDFQTNFEYPDIPVSNKFYLKNDEAFGYTLLCNNEGRLYQNDSYQEKTIEYTSNVQKYMHYYINISDLGNLNNYKCHCKRNEGLNKKNVCDKCPNDKYSIKKFNECSRCKINQFMDISNKKCTNCHLNEIEYKGKCVKGCVTNKRRPYVPLNASLKLNTNGIFICDKESIPVDKNKIIFEFKCGESGIEYIDEGLCKQKSSSPVLFTFQYYWLFLFASLFYFIKFI